MTEELVRAGLFHLLTLSRQDGKDMTDWPLDLVIEDDGTIRPAELNEQGIYEYFIRSDEFKNIPERRRRI